VIGPSLRRRDRVTRSGPSPLPQSFFQPMMTSRSGGQAERKGWAKNLLCGWEIDPFGDIRRRSCTQLMAIESSWPVRPCAHQRRTVRSWRYMAQTVRPYLVRWSDTKRESLFSASHVTNWHTGLYLYEADEDTVAHAVLHGASQERLVSRGTTRNRAGEANVPEIGNEVAISTGLAESGRSATYDRIGRYVRSRRPSGSHRALRMRDI
jgi:hypothetical protein